MGLFQKFKDVFKSKKEREEELKEILDVEESLEDEALKDESFFEDDVVEEEIANDSEEKEEVLTYNEPKQEDKKQEQAKKKQKKKVKLTEKDKDLVTYDKGLEKTRKEFVSELSLLGKKFTKVTEEYYEELESLLFKADIGVNTVFKFIDRLRNRVKHENITDTVYLTEVIVDEFFMIYVEV